jgi:hypothetical protein
MLYCIRGYFLVLKSQQIENSRHEEILANPAKVEFNDRLVEC